MCEYCSLTALYLLSSTVLLFVKLDGYGVQNEKGREKGELDILAEVWFYCCKLKVRLGRVVAQRECELTKAKALFKAITRENC